MEENKQNNDLNDEKKKILNSLKLRKKKNSKQKPDSGDFDWSRIFKTVLSWAVLIVAIFMLMTLFRGQSSSEFEITFTQYQDLLSNKKIAKVVISKKNLNDYDLHGTLISPQELNLSGNKRTRIERFHLLLPYSNIDDPIIATWTNNNVSFTIERDDNLWLEAIISILPWLLILAFGCFYLSECKMVHRKEFLLSEKVVLNYCKKVR